MDDVGKPLQVGLVQAEFLMKRQHRGAGDHEVVLTYVPPFGRAAGAVSLLALACYGLLLAGWRPTRPRQAPSETGELHQQAADADQRPGERVGEAPAGE